MRVFPSISPIRTPIRKVRYAVKRCPVYFYDRERIARFSGRAGFASHAIAKVPGAGMDYVVTFSNA